MVLERKGVGDGGKGGCSGGGGGGGGSSKGHPATGRGGPKGFRSVKAPDFLDVRHYKCGRSSVIRTGRLYPRRNSWYSFSEAESTPGHMVPLEPRKNPQRHQRESIPGPSDQ
jgi:hypothetical protein